MRIIHFDQMFHPEFGDQINILPKFQVKQGHEVFIVTGKSDVPHPRFVDFADNTNMDEKDKIFEEMTGVKIIRIDILRFISGRAIYKKGFNKIVDQLKPDILFCHFNDTVVGMYYTLKSNKLKYPVIFDSHMLDMAAKNKFKKVFRLFYKMFMTPIIKKNNLIVIRTQDNDYVNKELGVPNNLTPFVSFGSDTTIFKPNPIVREKFRKKYKINDNDFVVLYTGKLNEEKGAKLLAKVFEEEFKSNRKLTLVVVGNASEEYEKELEIIFSKSKNCIIRFPTQKYIDLPKFYQMADVCVFPKQCSLSFYDAQACGLPVIAEDNSINKERLSFKNGLLYKENSIDDLKSKIEYLANLDRDQIENYKTNSVNYIKKDYDYLKITQQYEQIIQKEYNRFYLKD